MCVAMNLFSLGYKSPCYDVVLLRSLVGNDTASHTHCSTPKVEGLSDWHPQLGTIFHEIYKPLAR